MKFKHYMMLFVTALTMSLSLPAAATNFYLKMPNINGESDYNSGGWIDVHGISGDFSKMTCGEITIQKSLDSATPYLILAAIEGTTYPQAIIEAVSGSGFTQFRQLSIKLLDVSVSSVAAFRVDSEGNPVETLMLNPSQMDIVYYEQGGDGSQGAERGIRTTCKKTGNQVY